MGWFSSAPALPERIEGVEFDPNARPSDAPPSVGLLGPAKIATQNGAGSEFGATAALKR
jgi:hypothetical protein